VVIDSPSVGMHVVITGASSGIGEALARETFAGALP
jgi:short-subunit dehydrogenase